MFTSKPKAKNAVKLKTYIPDPRVNQNISKNLKKNKTVIKQKHKM